MYGQSPTDQILRHAIEHNATVVDLRSDTISKPSQAMRRAMYEAQLGDDVYGEDPTVKELEEKAARLVGMEAAIFVPTGTMGNLIAVMVHCDVRGCEMYASADSHVAHHEQGGAAQIAGVTVCTLTGLPDGTFDLAQLESKLKSDWQHEPFSRLVACENTTAGRVLPQKWLDELVQLAKSRELKLHMDGARLWNASVASGLPADRIVRDFDSVTFCLSKGLAAPAGSLLCGDREFVRKARRTRKVLGGSMRQAGVLAAAGLVALEQIVPLLERDHRRARSVAETVDRMASKIFCVDPTIGRTNMVVVKIDSTKCKAKDFVARLQRVEDPEVDDDRILVRGLALSDDMSRLVFYHEITDEMTAAAARKIQLVIREFERAML